MENDRRLFLRLDRPVSKRLRKFKRAQFEGQVTWEKVINTLLDQHKLMRRIHFDNNGKRKDIEPAKEPDCPADIEEGIRMLDLISQMKKDKGVK